MENRKYLYGHTSPETAYVVEDYPWGFKLRTTIRYWIESRPGKVGGQRFMSQTINPKTGLWCKPKASNYYEIMVIYLDEKDHIQWECLYINDSRELIESFMDRHWQHLDTFQMDRLEMTFTWCDFMNKLEWSVSKSGVNVKLKEECAL